MPPGNFEIFEVCSGASEAQTDLKSTIQRNRPLKEARLGIMNRILFERVQHCLGPPLHWKNCSNFTHCPYTWGFSPFPVGIAIQ